jgi:hypothetical protein
MNHKRQVFQLLHHKLSIDRVATRRPMTLISSTDQPPTIDLIAFLGQHTNPLTSKLPAIGNIAFTTHLAFVSIEQIDFVCLRQLLHNSQPLKSILVERWTRLPFYWLANPFVSSRIGGPTTTFKKRRKASRPIDLPCWFSHWALAVWSFWRLALIKSRALCCSCSVKINALRPRPGLVSKPWMPSALYRQSQLLTLISHILTIPATSLEWRPSALSRTNWQRLRTAWLWSLRNRLSNSAFAFSSSSGVLTRPIRRKYNNLN